MGYGAGGILIVVVGLVVVEIILCCGQGEGIDRIGSRRARRLSNEMRVGKRLGTRERLRVRVRIGRIGNRLRLV